MATTSSLAPISLASTIIGFISFSLTLLIWLNAFWTAFETLSAAPEQVRDGLSTLRQNLYEEREYLRRLRRRRDPGDAKARALYDEGGPTKIITQAVKDLIAQFKRYEAPFLVAAYEGREKELEWSFDATQQRYRCDLPRRLLWLRYKSGVERIAVLLQRVQTRRISVEVTETRFMVADCMGLVRDCEDRLVRIDRSVSELGRG